MIKLYSTHCPKCKVLEKKLAQDNMEVTIIDDMDEVIKFGQEHNMNFAPILVVGDKLMDFNETNKWLNQATVEEKCDACKL